MKIATASLTHPILFVLDFANHQFSVPEYDPDATVSATEDGLSIKAIADVDGEVTVRLTDTIPAAVAAEAHLVFAGTVRAPNRQLAVVTSANERLLELEVSSVQPLVRIVVDSPEFPSDIWVEAR